MSIFVSKIAELIEAGKNAASYSAYDAWVPRVNAFLGAALEGETAQAFMDLIGPQAVLNWEKYKSSQLGFLDGLALKLAQQEEREKRQATPGASPPSPSGGRPQLRLAAGSAEAAAEITAFLTKLGLELASPQEVPSPGATIILLERDDRGAWRPRLAQELIRAGLPIELAPLLEEPPA